MEDGENQQPPASLQTSRDLQPAEAQGAPGEDAVGPVPTGPEAQHRQDICRTEADDRSEDHVHAEPEQTAAVSEAEQIQDTHEAEANYDRPAEELPAEQEQRAAVPGTEQVQATSVAEANVEPPVELPAGPEQTAAAPGTELIEDTAGAEANDRPAEELPAEPEQPAAVSEAEQMQDTSETNGDPPVELPAEQTAAAPGTELVEDTAGAEANDRPAEELPAEQDQPAAVSQAEQIQDTSEPNGDPPVDLPAEQTAAAPGTEPVEDTAGAEATDRPAEELPAEPEQAAAVSEAEQIQNTSQPNGDLPVELPAEQAAAAPGAEQLQDTSLAEESALPRVELHVGPEQQDPREMAQENHQNGEDVHMGAEIQIVASEDDPGVPLQQQAPAALADNELQLEYPKPLATHQEILESEEMFVYAMHAMHTHLGLTLEKIPRLSGKGLDLHMLYQQVTNMGGCEHVISKKLWKDVAEPFQFPSTITSCSYALRKAYFTFLWHVEQVYYHGRAGPVVPLPTEKDREEDRLKRMKDDNSVLMFPGLAPGAPNAFTGFASGHTEDASAQMVGVKGSCVIDARFDCGYFCTIKFGKQEFKGTLYCPPPQFTIQPSPPKPKGEGRETVTGAAPTDQEELAATSSRKKDKGKDPNAPKPNKTPFNYFSVDARVKAKADFPYLSQTDITKKVGEMWHSASQAEKDPYIAMALKDKQRYTAAHDAYKFLAQAKTAQAEAEAARRAVAAAQLASASGHPLSFEQTLETPNTGSIETNLVMIAPPKKKRKLSVASQPTAVDLPHQEPAKTQVAPSVPAVQLEPVMGTSYALQVVHAPMQMAQVDMATMHGLAMVGQVAYDANGNPVTVTVAQPQ